MKILRDNLLLLLLVAAGVLAACFLHTSDHDTGLTGLSATPILEGIRTYNEEYIGDSWSYLSVRNLDLTLMLEKDTLPQNYEAYIGAGVYDSESDQLLGTIVDITKNEQVTITISCSYVCTQSSTKTGSGIRLALGKAYDCYIVWSDITFHGTITEIKPAEQ